MTPIDQSLKTKEENGHEEDRVAEKQVSFSADRRENQGAGRLAGADYPPAACPSPGRRSPRLRGEGGGRGRGVGAPPDDFDRRDLQESEVEELRHKRGSLVC